MITLSSATALRSHRATKPRWPFVKCLAAILPLTLAWAIATPVMGVVDEPAHLLAAAAAIRGQFNGPLVDAGPLGKQSRIEAPESLVALQHVSDCLVFFPQAVPTDCPANFTSSQQLVTTVTPYSRNPQLFYLLVGWTTLAFSGRHAYYAAVAVAAVLNGLILALGLWALLVHHPRRLASFGFLVAGTPAVFYLAASVNSSGPEIAAAIATWATALTLIEYEKPPITLVVATAVATAAFTVARPASPLFAATTMVAVAFLAGRRRLVAYLHQRAIRIAAIALVAVASATVIWRVAVGAPQLLGMAPNRTFTAFEAARRSFPYTWARLEGMVGKFLAMGAPAAAVVLWAVALLALALVAGPRLPRAAWLVVGGLVGAVILVPVVGDVSAINQIYLWWQPRYTIPLAVGVPFVLACQARRDSGSWWLERWSPRCIVVAVVAAQLVTFVWILHRYTSGTEGSWWPPDFRWQPPGGALLVTGLFVVGLGTLIAIIGRAKSRDDPDRAFTVTVP